MVTHTHIHTHTLSLSPFFIHGCADWSLCGFLSHCCWCECETLPVLSVSIPIRADVTVESHQPLGGREREGEREGGERWRKHYRSPCSLAGDPATSPHIWSQSSVKVRERERVSERESERVREWERVRVRERERASSYLLLLSLSLPSLCLYPVSCCLCRDNFPNFALPPFRSKTTFNGKTRPHPYPNSK